MPDKPKNRASYSRYACWYHIQRRIVLFCSTSVWDTHWLFAVSNNVPLNLIKYNFLTFKYPHSPALSVSILDITVLAKNELIVVLEAHTAVTRA